MRNDGQVRHAFGCGQVCCSGSPHHPFGSVCLARAICSLAQAASESSPSMSSGTISPRMLIRCCPCSHLRRSVSLLSPRVAQCHLRGVVIEQALHREQVDVVVDHPGRVGVAERVRAEGRTGSPCSSRRSSTSAQRRSVSIDERVAPRPLSHDCWTSPAGTATRSLRVGLADPGALGGDRVAPPGQRSARPPRGGACGSSSADTARRRSRR